MQLHDGFKDRVPKTADEFAAYWRKHKLGKASIEAADAEMKASGNNDRVEAFRESAKSKRAMRASKNSNFLISYPMMVRLAMTRRYQMQMNDLPTLLITTVYVFSFLFRSFSPFSVLTAFSFLPAPPCSKPSSLDRFTGRWKNLRAASSVVEVLFSSPSSFVDFFPVSSSFPG